MLLSGVLNPFRDVTLVVEVVAEEKEDEREKQELIECLLAGMLLVSEAATLNDFGLLVSEAAPLNDFGSIEMVPCVGLSPWVDQPRKNLTFL